MISKTLFITILLSVTYNCNSQNIEAPSIRFVTVNNASKNASLSWSYPEKDKIDGFIIKRFIYKFQGVADNTYNTIATIKNPEADFFTDTTTVYGKCTPDTRIEKYRIAAYRNIEGSVKLSIMSNIHETVFPEAKYDICTKSNTVKWNGYNIWKNNLSKYEIYAKTGSGNFSLIGIAGDTIFTHTEVSENRNYEYLIKSINVNSDISVSCITSIYTKKELINGTISNKYVFVSDNNKIELKFEVKPDKNIKSYSLFKFRDNKFVPIADFPADVSENIIYTDTNINAEKVYRYYLAGKNICDEIVANSDTVKNLTISATIKDKSLNINSINLSEQKNDLGKFDYKIFRSISGNQYAEIGNLETKTDYEDNITEILVQEFKEGKLDGIFCYYIEKYNSETGEKVRVSNKSCIKRDASVFIPNAFNPDSDTEENRTFKPKIAFVNSYNIVIYNSGGQKIYTNFNPSSGWDGTYKGKRLPTGVFYYIISCKDANDIQKIFKGYVTLVNSE